MIAPTAVPGGSEEVLFNLASCLPAHGIAPSVISLEPGPLVDRLTQLEVAVTIVEAGRLRQLGDLRRTASRLGRTLGGKRFDAVFSNMPKAHIYAAFPAWRRSVPAFWCQASIPNPPAGMDRLASVLPAAGAIAVSRAAVAAQRRLNPRLPVHLMHPGIDIGRFRVSRDPALRAANGIPHDAVLVSLVGRLQPWKGQREFLRAVAILVRSDPKLRVAIVGGAILGWEGDYPAELERLASSLGLDQAITFTGHTGDAHRWMAASDIVVNASQPEPFGLVVVEAMASGCAVVAVDAGGPRDIIEHGRSGLLCASRDPADLAEAIAKLTRDPELRAGLGQAGRARVEAEFARERMASRFAEILLRPRSNRPRAKLSLWGL
jgi:glycosyltransferase involved in cell wall biosynthesis